MDVAEAFQIPEVYRRINFPDAIGEVLPEDIMYFHLVIGLLFAAVALHRLVLPI